jgi:hypothetical protein
MIGRRSFKLEARRCLAQPQRKKITCRENLRCTIQLITTLLSTQLGHDATAVKRRTLVK